MPDPHPPANNPIIQVPATTANLGPGFDCLGIALQLYNRVQLGSSLPAWENDFFTQVAAQFLTASGIQPEPCQVVITGDVPRSRGLGSSVTVRLGMLMALNARHDHCLSPAKLLEATITLEGHPDNAVPAFSGGFAVCSPNSHLRFAIDPRLHFVLAIPDFELATEQARSVLPMHYEKQDVIYNIQHACTLAAGLAIGDYAALRGAMKDRIHQPHRLPLIPGATAALDAACQSGALDACLSGSGSTLLAICLHNSEEIASAMADCLRHAGHTRVETRIVTADNQGAIELPA